MPAIRRGWEAMHRAVHEDNGQVGWLQGTGSKPEDGGVITYNSIPNFEDFGYGCWLWGAAEAHALASKIEAEAAGITEIRHNPTPTDTYYDLSGRRVTAPVRGRIYIHNGKKERKSEE